MTASKLPDNAGWMHLNGEPQSAPHVPGYTGDQVIAYARAAVEASQPDPWKPSGLDYDRSIHHNPDAAAWADFFVATFPAQAGQRDLMLGWFANAMMAMHDHIHAQPKAEVVAYMHRLEEQGEYPGPSETRFTLDEDHPFGSLGESFGRTYSVTTTPLYTRPQPSAADALTAKAVKFAADARLTDWLAFGGTVTEQEALFALAQGGKP
jgi:hypothetical protein